MLKNVVSRVAGGEGLEKGQSRPSRAGWETQRVCTRENNVETVLRERQGVWALPTWF